MRFKRTFHYIFFAFRHPFHRLGTVMLLNLPLNIYTPIMNGVQKGGLKITYLGASHVVFDVGSIVTLSDS